MKRFFNSDADTFAWWQPPVKQARQFRDPKPQPKAAFVASFRIAIEAYEAVEQTLGKFPAETGGLLLGHPDTGLITDFLFDHDARTSGSIYYPTVEFLNREIPRYEAQGKHPLGIAHSHPVGLIKPSSPDMSAAYSNITSLHNSHLKTWHMPIIQSAADTGQFEFHPYIVSCGKQAGETVLHAPMLEIVDANGKPISRAKLKQRAKARAAKDTPTVAEASAVYLLPPPTIAPAAHFKILPTTLARLNQDYARVAGHVDFAKMLDTCIIHIGVGASGTSIEQFSRLGVKRWILFDPDTVEKKNLVAQDFEIADVGKLKVDAIKERMERCEFENGSADVPPLQISTFADFLEPDDATLDALIEAEKRNYGQVILVAATDFHPAQARAARLGIRHAIPAFFIGAYRDGLAGETIFYDPAANDMPCYRCIVASRYAAFDGRPPESQRAAKSSGLPFAIGVLDSQLGHLVVGCIHRDQTESVSMLAPQAVLSNTEVTDIPIDAAFEAAVAVNQHARLYQELVADKRNFIQTQLNPSYRMAGEDIFRDAAGVHGSKVKTFISMFETDVKNPHCPDCANSTAWQHTDYRKDAP